MKFALPLVVFMVLGAFLVLGLQRDPSLLPSTLLDKPVPTFEAPLLLPATTGATGNLDPASLLGSVWVLNIWASWCVACVSEHAVITDLKTRSGVAIVGLNYKDEAPDATAWLQRFGNPYDHVPVDPAGRIGIDFGLYGVPETYIIDKAGQVRYKHVGPVDEQALEKTLLPLIQELEAASA